MDGTIEPGEPTWTAREPTVDTLRRHVLIAVLAVVIRSLSGTRLVAGNWQGLIELHNALRSEAKRQPIRITAVDVPYADSRRFGHALREASFWRESVTYNAASAAPSIG